MQLFFIQHQLIVTSYTKITIQVKNLILLLSQTCRMTWNILLRTYGVF